MENTLLLVYFCIWTRMLWKLSELASAGKQKVFCEVGNASGSETLVICSGLGFFPENIPCLLYKYQRENQTQLKTTTKKGSKPPQKPNNKKSPSNPNKHQKTLLKEIDLNV